MERTGGTRGPGCSAGGWQKPGNCTHGRRHGETNLAQQEARRAASVQNSPSTPPRTACAGQNSPCTPLLTACAVQNSPCSPEMAQFGAFYACRESFVPLSPPRSQAGRILYRTQGRDGARQHNRTPCPTGMKSAGGHRRNRRARAGFEARGLTTLPAGRDGTWSRQISHVISDGHFLRPPKNVAIPTR